MYRERYDCEPGLPKIVSIIKILEHPAYAPLNFPMEW